MRPVPPKQGKRVLPEYVTLLWKRLKFIQKDEAEQKALESFVSQGDVDAWLRVEETILDVPAGDVTKEAYLFVPENLEEVDRFVHLRIRESREPYVLDDDHVLITEKMAGLLAFRLPTYTGIISC